jgi:hypothetical protein
MAGGWKSGRRIRPSFVFGDAFFCVFRREAGEGVC